MKKFSYIVSDELGIHARPAGMLVKEASKFRSNIKIVKGGQEVDAKRIFGVMGLGVKKGDEICIYAEGQDEEEAIVAMEEFLKNSL